ncbi:uncharacterized protein ACIQIH_011008 isoform 1-T3 [Cyanocitta cristata]
MTKQMVKIRTRTFHVEQPEVQLYEGKIIHFNINRVTAWTSVRVSTDHGVKRKLHIPSSASNQPISRRNIKQFIAFACTAWVNLLSNDEIQGLETCIFANCVPATARIQAHTF